MTGRCAGWPNECRTDFLSVEDLVQIPDEQVAPYGGAAGVRDQGLLESVVAMPRTSFGEV